MGGKNLGGEKFFKDDLSVSFLTFGHSGFHNFRLGKIDSLCCFLKMKDGLLATSPRAKKLSVITFGKKPSYKVTTYYPLKSYFPKM